MGKEVSLAKKRNANIELLRIIATFMVIMLHLFGKSGLLVPVSEDGSINNLIAWFLEAACISCIDIYVLISGYFLVDSEFHLGRFIELILETLFYTVGVFIFMFFTGIVDISGYGIYDYLKVIFPIEMSAYWYVTVYILMYALSPLLSAGVHAISEKSLKLIIILLLIYHSVFKSIMPFKFEIDDDGYGIGWFITLYLIAAFFKLYGIKWLDSVKKGFTSYITGTVLIFAEYILVQLVIKNTGRLNYIGSVSYSYNHLFTLLASLGLFAAFINMKDRSEGFLKAVRIVSPTALGIYLLHENVMVRYEWQKWLNVDSFKAYNPVCFVLASLGAALIVFIAGFIVDKIRIFIFNFFKEIFIKVGKKNA